MPMLDQITTAKQHGVASFGGGYSNHIHALGYICYRLNIPFYAVIRGDYAHNLTPMLRDIIAWGTKIIYVTKIEYQRRTDPQYQAQLQHRLRVSVIIPEGGSAQGHFVGMQQLHDEVTTELDLLVCPLASGGTLAGLAMSEGKIKALLGVAVLKGPDYLSKLVKGLLSKGPKTPYTLTHEHHFNGYAKAPAELQMFCQQMEQQLAIPFEPVYSGKALHAFKHVVESGQFPVGSQLALLHTGGLQGARPSQC